MKEFKTGLFGVCLLIAATLLIVLIATYAGAGKSVPGTGHHRQPTETLPDDTGAQVLPQ